MYICPCMVKVLKEEATWQVVNGAFEVQFQVCDRRVTYTLQTLF